MKAISNVSLKTKFIALMVGLIVVACVVNLSWTSVSKQAQMENELQEKGRVLSQQMDAVWQFMASNQDRLEEISFTENGVYQGLHCAIVGRSIAQSFSTESDYVTRFVNFSPRNSANEPDEVESAALTLFSSDSNVTEYYEISEYDGERVFRYLAPMQINENCLDCHGTPAGEIDVTGYPKEGWEAGDIGGAISIVIPLDVYEENNQSSIVQDLLFFLFLLMTCLVILYLALSYLVTRPIKKIQEGIEAIQHGSLDASVQLESLESSEEMNQLRLEFNRMADELKDVYGNLESQVEIRTVQLEEANKVLTNQRKQLEEINYRLRKDSQYKAEFLAMMSHELRTPLASILAFSELLNCGCRSDNFESEEVINEIEKSSRLLLMMINDILEMSRVDAGKATLNLEKIDLGDVVGMVKVVVSPLAKRSDILFSCDIDSDVPLIEGDFEKIRHILENLCGNAVKFTEPDGSVDLKVHYVSTCSQVHCVVSDTGIGIDSADFSRIFEKFAQADSSTSRRYSGTGLGLALVKEYAEMHGGEVVVESAVGKGSVFTVKLPILFQGSKD